ncbi:MAG TPA: GDP-mannose 4,6-dehydratase [Planctomycetota bacterium]|nr:GDP-mannose 4,6-dehydratase [Planctomycetota bacterium]
MKVLVTGGAGFIGSHLAESLIARGEHVSVLDDLSTGDLSNLAALQGHERFAQRIGSVTDAALVAELVDAADVVVHLAAAVGVRLIVERPVHTIETNVHGTEVVLHAAAKHKKLVLIASTSEVYGKSTKIPFREDDDLVLGATTHSRWAYACSKALDEWLAFAYFREQQVPVVICRLFNTVGPRQTGRHGMVLPNFAAQALRGEPMTVHGTGEQTRCFAHVRDAVESMVRLLETPAARGEVFNVGSGREITIRALAELVRARAGSRSEVVLVPYEKAYARGFEDMQRRVPDCSKLERAIRFKPHTPLEQIVDDVLLAERSKT